MDSSDEDDDRFFDADEDARAPDQSLATLLPQSRDAASALPSRYKAAPDNAVAVATAPAILAAAAGDVAPATTTTIPAAALAHNHHYSLHAHPPPIPARFRDLGNPAQVSPRLEQRPSTAGELSSASSPRYEHRTRSQSRPRSQNGRPRHDSEAAQRRRSIVEHSRFTTRRHLADELDRSPSPSVDLATLARLENRAKSEVGGITMARATRTREQQLHQSSDEDLFLELADNPAEDSHVDTQSTVTSRADKRKSLPLDTILARGALDRAAATPTSTGSLLGRPSSRLHALTVSSSQPRASDFYARQSLRNSIHEDDVISMSGLSQPGRTRRFSAAPERSPLSPTRRRDILRSPDRSQFPRTLPTSPRTRDEPEDSPAESSDNKQPGSDSAESQTADTVWDELDDLKSRIKKLELTGGKVPATSSAALSGDSERPRTATTAPTTIDSSPKNDRKSTVGTGSGIAKLEEPAPQLDPTPQQPMAATHPLLTDALAKAKPLLNGSLYRILEATSMDAMQLVSMTGGATSPGTPTLGAIPTVDRQVRRKADTMCRNLTDLCLALCDGKHELPSSGAQASPLVLDAPGLSFPRRSPSLRPTRRILNDAGGAARPISRLEARRSSILGIPPREGSDHHSGSENDASTSTPGHHNQYESPYDAPRRISRAPSSLLRSRLQPRTTYADEGAAVDDDPTIRPPSRAMTDIGGLRARAAAAAAGGAAASVVGTGRREFLLSGSHSMTTTPQNRELTRAASIIGSGGPDSAPAARTRRRLFETATPPVAEEDGNRSSDDPSARPRRRLSSFAASSARRRSGADFFIHGRAVGEGSPLQAYTPYTRLAPPQQQSPAVSQHRHVAVE